MNSDMTEKTDNTLLQRKLGSTPSRREFLGTAAGGALLPLLPWQTTLANPSLLETLQQEVTGAALVQQDAISLELPRVADNGNSVALKVTVDSPMSADDYVKSIHLFAPANPRPVIARYYLNPRSGRAEINTRIRLAATQEVIALAAMSDGSFRQAGAKVIVAVAACIDGS